MDLCHAKKITIVGNSGAGKSTFANKLGASLGVDVFSIDKIYWLAGWRLRNPASFKKLHDKWLAQDAWIIDGVGYWEQMARRIVQSDCVVFLDVPVAVCKARAETRIEQEKLTQNPHITPGCVYAEVKALQIEVIEHFHNELRPQLLEYLSGFNPEKIRVISELEAGF